MRTEILQILQESGDSFVSGQILCEKFGVTRQAVWKAVSTLKEMGYEIESVPRRGYRLISSPDRLYGPQIEAWLPQGCLCRKVVDFDVTDSTNTQAKRLAEQGEPEGTLVVADEQTGGKGRRGRGWETPHGTSIAMSLILRPHFSPVQASGLTLLAGLAVARGIEQICGVTPQIKWPNDIVLNGRKVCGILTEMSSEINMINYAIVGIGINANQTAFPEDVADIACSVAQVTGQKVNRQRLVAAVTAYLCEYYLGYIERGDLSQIIPTYNAMLANMDRQVKVYHGMIDTARPEDIEVGIARGIDASGALLVETEHGMEAVVSGEVSVRGLYGYV